MSQAYTPGLEVSEFAEVIKRRELPLPGKALVAAGARVEATTEVLAADLPGELDIVRIADRLGLEADQVLGGMKVTVGQDVKRGDVLCEIKSFFGWFSSAVKAPCSGTVEFFTESNAHLGLRQPSKPLKIRAYVAGTVEEVEEGKAVSIRAEGAFFQGVFGVGGETLGEIFVLDCPADGEVTEEMLKKSAEMLEGKILIGGKNFTIDALQHAARSGARGVVTGSVDAQTLSAFVGHEIGVSITGDEDVPFTFIITEGFGALPISQRILQLAIRLNGRQASVNGATQVRAGAMRPEVIVPRNPSEKESGGAVAPATAKILQIGSSVRLIRVPYFGLFGTVSKLPHDPVAVASGAVVRVAHVRLDDTREVIVPRANIELA
jgi:hypothetical protein